MKKNINLIIIFTSIIYEEMLFSLLTKNNMQNICLKIMFIIHISLFFIIISSIFNKKINKIIYNSIIIIIPILFCIYYIYFKLLDTIPSINLLIESTKAIRFFNSAKNIILAPSIILFLLPPIIYYIFGFKRVKQEKLEKKSIIKYLIIMISLHACILLIINTSKTGTYSIKNLYYNTNNTKENYNNFGLITTIRLDIQRNIFNFKEKQYNFENNNNIIEKNSENYNMTNIDFDKIIKNSSSEEIKEITEYIKQQEPSNKNEYTGKFKDKNLIFIVGESFSLLSIDKNITPTLYKMANTGMKFNNFYTPLFPVSTADGQYLVDNSILPSEGTWSIEKVDGNAIPYSYANVLKKIGYKTYAYHNNDYDYYKRDKYFKTLGFEKYLGIGNGLENKIEDKNNFNSDYEMIKATIPDYINDEHFLAYYVTMSGHMAYNKKNNIVNKNWDMVKNLEYSDNVKGYLATQIELDKALEKMIQELKKAKKLEDTVIVIVGDHYPYGLKENEMKELMNNKEEYYFERFHMPLIIYNGEKEITKEIDKFASSLDVLPTVLNLFGVEFDSRLLLGKDILSNNDSLIIFSDRGFIDKNRRYNSKINKLEENKTKIIDDEYIEKIKNQIYLKYRYSRLILENDYYKQILE